MTGLDQIGMALFGLAALWMAMGRSQRQQKWAPIVGLIGQPFWAAFAWRLHTAGIPSESLPILIPAFSAMYLRGAWVQWRPKA
jgi:hypothetical protein